MSRVTFSEQTRNDVLTISSREIADLISKHHDNVMAIIRDLITDHILTPEIQEVDYRHQENTYKHFLINKRDSLVLVARLSPEFTAHIVDHWQELEQHLSPVFNLPQDLPSALRALADTHDQLQQVQFERDIAIKTKAQINDKKTATAMATASHAIQENVRLKDQIGQSRSNATIRSIEKMTGKSYKWQPLKAWCTLHNVESFKVHDPLYGTVRSYPAEAWMEIYNIDLYKLFGRF